MKSIFKKNQMMIAVLALMIAVAGYLNFTSRDVTTDSKDVLGNGVDETVGANGMDVNSNYYEGALGNSDDALISANVEDSIQGNETAEGEMDDKSTLENGINTDEIGETVLTSAAVMDNFLSQAKLNREQVRAKTKEMLNDIIQNSSLSEDAKEDAIRQMITLTENMQKEAEAEQQLGIKGFVNAIVSISEDSVDVSVAKTELTDVEKAQIEDIIIRKTGCEIQDIVITTMGSSQESEK
ncbi:MAG: SpoIIIAH-like family protein [Lachnospiraceae bacterium]|nr:SpoIIIAH-like family protein [Lachnospiraceae bacterium]